MRVSVIIPAAGSSTRYAATPDAPRSKLDEDLGGKTVLQRSIELFSNRSDIAQILVVAPSDDDRLSDFRLRHADRLALLGCTLVVGGRERSESVKNASEMIDPSCTHVAVHDAARPATSEAIINRVFDAATRHDAVIPVLPVRDTLKRVRSEPVDDETHDPLDAILGAQERPKMFEVESGISREHLVAVHTPQVFERSLFGRMYAQDDLSSTDDASLAERLGARVVTVESEPTNIKLTTHDELAILRAVMRLDGPKARKAHKRF